jgi:hypothetical protein
MNWLEQSRGRAGSIGFVEFASGRDCSQEIFLLEGISQGQKLQARKDSKDISKILVRIFYFMHNTNFISSI